MLDNTVKYIRANDDMQMCLVLAADFPYEELIEIAALLEEAEVFVAGYIPPSLGLCNVDGFLHQALIENSETILLPDRNIVSRMAQVAKGDPLDGRDSEQKRTAAAILALAQGLDIKIEPSVAFHELAPSQGNEIAHGELAWFRVADNGDFHEWAAIALGRSDRIQTIGTPPSVGPFDLAKPLRRWRRNYATVLKIGALELNKDLRAVDRVLSLFQWMYSEFILAGPAAIFACVYFAPNEPPRRGLLKGLRSPNRERAIAGIQNAAWDITHISDFVRRINEEPAENPRRYILATLDEGLRAVARLVVGQRPSLSPKEELTLSLSQWWPDADAKHIAEAWFDYLVRVREPGWWDQYKDRDYVGEVIEQGEQTTRAWQP